MADLKALVELAAALQAHLGADHQVVVDLVFEGTQQRTGTGGRAASSGSAKDSAIKAMREGRWDDGACLCVAMSVCVCVCVPRDADGGGAAPLQGLLGLLHL